jgi:hypothetical protein
MGLSFNINFNILVTFVAGIHERRYILAREMVLE